MRTDMVTQACRGRVLLGSGGHSVPHVLAEQLWPAGYTIERWPWWGLQAMDRGARW